MSSHKQDPHLTAEEVSGGWCHDNISQKRKEHPGLETEALRPTQVPQFLLCRCSFYLPHRSTDYNTFYFNPLSPAASAAYADRCRLFSPCREALGVLHNLLCLCTAAEHQGPCCILHDITPHSWLPHPLSILPRGRSLQLSSSLAAQSNSSIGLFFSNTQLINMNAVFVVRLCTRPRASLQAELLSE